MLALAAAVVFLIDLILHWVGAKVSAPFDLWSLALLGLTLLAFHFAYPIAVGRRTVVRD